MKESVKELPVKNVNLHFYYLSVADILLHFSFPLLDQYAAWCKHCFLSLDLKRDALAQEFGACFPLMPVITMTVFTFSYYI